MNVGVKLMAAPELRIDMAAICKLVLQLNSRVPVVGVIGDVTWIRVVQFAVNPGAGGTVTEGKVWVMAAYTATMRTGIRMLRAKYFFFRHQRGVGARPDGFSKLVHLTFFCKEVC